MGSCLGADKDEEKVGLVGKSRTGEARQYDKNFKGPIQDRSCTDVICCLLFAFCVAILLLFAVIAYARGDPKRIIYPTDSEGKICGKDLPDRTKLAYFDFTVCARMGIAVLQLGCPTPQVCVSECPSAWWSWLTAQTHETAIGRVSAEQRRPMVCLRGRNGLHPEYVGRSIKSLVDDGLCAPFTMPTIDLMGRCMPKLLEDIGGKIVDSLGSVPSNITAGNNQTVGTGELRSGTAVMSKFVKVYGFLQSVFQDVVKTWPYILTGFILAVLLSLLWVLLLRFVARIMVITAIVGFVFVFVFLVIFTFYKYAVLKKETKDIEEKFKLTSDIGYYSQLSTTWLIIGIVSAAILVIVIVLLIWLRERISIAIAIISETSKCIAHMMTTLLFPIVPFLLQLLVLVFCVVTSLYIGSMGKPEMRSAVNQTAIDSLNTSGMSEAEAKAKIDSVLNQLTPCNPNAAGTEGSICRFIKYGDDGFSVYMQMYTVFMFLWLFNFVDGLCQMTLAGAFASYYFAFNKPKDIPTFPLLASFWRCIRYHMGSIAFGSLIIAIVQAIRIILEYIDAKLSGSQNPIGKFFIKCLKCCFWCLEKFVKFISKNAYIMVAIYGRNFCLSAKDAFFLILRNIVRVAVVDKITEFVLFISKMVIIGLIGSLAFFFFDGTLGQKSEVIGKVTPKGMDYYFVPVILIIVFSYFCTSLFFAVYSMGVDTIFLCFLEDLERHDGSAEKPYYMSAELMDILGKKNEAPPPPPPSADEGATATTAAEGDKSKD
ncbi:hypothetical protein BOX15_Mlig025792g1 [Macrostomum lignano]|uniref:Choline transporter-like protein n=1 Tax=Macrostomum lignano TaxID=282301 RepID=A0A267FCR9_9PLAT|nr:hypothetical protein BOX15_Mlig025792g1 [Macrostomum lignano]